MKYYSVDLPTKPYLKKYLTTIEGNPVFMSSNSLFCLMLRACLGNNTCLGLSADQKSGLFASLTEIIQVRIPISKMRLYGYSLSADHILLINRHIEKDFETELVRFCRAYVNENVRYAGYKETYEKFADHYNIEIEEDIQYETLKKMEYRARKKLSKIRSKNVLSLLG